MSKAYVVRGSEDGILAVFSNLKQAKARAIDYATINAPLSELFSYNGQLFYHYESTDGSYSEVEAFEINAY
jgi:hypothetical protein